MGRAAKIIFIDSYEKTGKKGKIFNPKLQKTKPERIVYPDQGIIGENTEPQILISEELLAEMKKMSPQDLMNSLINPTHPNSEEQEEYELTDSVEIQDFVDWSHTPEPVYERPIPTFELVKQMMTTMSKEQVRYVLEKSLAN